MREPEGILSDWILAAFSYQKYFFKTRQQSFPALFDSRRSNGWTRSLHSEEGNQHFSVANSFCSVWRIKSDFCHSGPDGKSQRINLRLYVNNVHLFISHCCISDKVAAQWLFAGVLNCPYCCHGNHRCCQTNQGWNFINVLHQRSICHVNGILPVIRQI